MFYLDEIGRIQSKDEEQYLDTKLSPNEIDSIEAFLQVCLLCIKYKFQ